MEKILNFLDTHPDVALATVDGQRPCVRAMHIMQREERYLYFATEELKDLYVQLQQNPAAEVLAMTPDQSVRVQGMVRFDVDDLAGRAIYRSSPLLQRLWGNYRDLVYFRMHIDRADYYDLRTDPPILDTFR